MKIGLPFQFQLKLNKQYSVNKTLLPIGCDCHPAYMLSKLGLRKESLPFDWLDTKPHLALNFAYATIQSEFEFFLTDLDKNEQGKVFSKQHPEALFYHFDDLIENINLQNKITERSQRFIKLYKVKPNYFIHTISSNAFEQKEDLDFILESITNFTTLLKVTDKLLIYLRFDESLSENSKHVKLLENTIQFFPQVKIISYVREKIKYGIWGDESKYRQLIKSLGVKTKMRFPKITLLREK